MEFLDTFLTPDMLPTYNGLEYPFTLAMIYDQLDHKTKEDPNFEVFLPLVYYRHEAALTAPGSAVRVAPYKYFISNKGRVVNLRNPTAPTFVEWSLDSSGYPHIVVNIKKKAEPLTIHRAIACAFIPIPEALQGNHPKDLIVSHKDNRKTNFSTSNLQWVVPPEKLNGVA